MPDDVLEVMHRIRDFMFERVYLAEPRANAARPSPIRSLVDHYLEQPFEIPSSYRPDEADTTQVIDYVAGMTDRFALREYDRIFRLRLFPD